MPAGVRKFITLGFDPKVSPSGKYMAFEKWPRLRRLRANIIAVWGTKTETSSSNYINQHEK
jgi:hypothetical protein